ncbi:MAG: rhodanese-related sulfurtransferase [Ulvibacter sp.]|jgi:rhodanese-related sulfurtransferase
MKNIIPYIILFLFAATTSAQKSLDLLLQVNNNESIPYISVEELRNLQLTDSVVILDAREMKEFEVSHIASSKYVGYDCFSSEEITSDIDNKNALIVVYCSLGIRSEDIGEKLKKEGFTNVKNLYGGIFEWKNNDYPIIDSEGKDTENVHVYSIFWGKWLKNGKKVY